MYIKFHSHVKTWKHEGSMSSTRQADTYQQAVYLQKLKTTFFNAI